MSNIDLVGDFQCPLCGSSYFSTYGTGPLGLNGPASEWVSQCKGKASSGYKTGYAGCVFKWSRALPAPQREVALVRVRCEKKGCSTEVSTRRASYAWVAKPVAGEANSVFACSGAHLDEAVDDRAGVKPPRKGKKR